ncbi:MAG: ParA family protein [Clostridia bacterium]|nr:ParA family protein [Clostridia bacterium]
MKKIITAINNPKLNEELKKERKFEIIGKDIQYREAILDILEKNKLVDLIIISEEIPGEIELESLIERIKIINEKVKIIFILEKQNSDLEKILIKNNIIDIYYNDKINLNELIKIINKKEINMEEEIIKLKKIIEEKNISYNNEKKQKEKNKKSKRKIIDLIKQIQKKIISRIENKIESIVNDKKGNYKAKNMSTKIISFSGNHKSGKSTLALIISQYLSQRNYKVLLVDGDIEEQDLSVILKKNKKEKKNKKIKKKNFYEKKQKNKKRKLKKIKAINRNTKLTNKKRRVNYLYCKKIIKTFTTKINKNLYFFNEVKYLLKNKEKKNKEIIFLLLKKIKQNYDFIMIDLSKSNQDGINQEILVNSYINLIFMEPTLLGIKEIQKLLKVYLQEWKIPKNRLHIIENKKNFSSINKKLILKSIPLKNKIYEIRENKFYHILSNHYFKRKILIKNKSIKYNLDKIVNKIILK